MKRFARLMVLVFSICCVAAHGVHAQYPFGKNKVLYVPKSWIGKRVRAIRIDR